MHKPAAKIAWHCVNDNKFRLLAQRWSVLVVVVDVLVELVVLVDVEVVLVVVSHPLQVLSHCFEIEGSEHTPVAKSRSH